MRIAVDALGGDNAPREIVAGALSAARDLLHDELMVGKPDAIEAEWALIPTERLAAVLWGAVGMDEEPSSTLRAHPDASVAVAAGMVRDGEADAFFRRGTPAPRWLRHCSGWDASRMPQARDRHCYLSFARLATRRRGHRLLQAAGPLEFRYSWRCARETLLR